MFKYVRALREHRPPPKHVLISKRENLLFFDKRTDKQSYGQTDEQMFTEIIPLGRR